MDVYWFRAALRYIWRTASLPRLAKTPSHIKTQAASTYCAQVFPYLFRFAHAEFGGLYLIEFARGLLGCQSLAIARYRTKIIGFGDNFGGVFGICIFCGHNQKDWLHISNQGDMKDSAAMMIGFIHRSQLKRVD